MNLEQIQEKLISDFDIDKAIEILEKLDENFSKEDLIENARGLIKMTYTSREMDDVFFEAGYLTATRSYFEGMEVHYSLNFSLDIQSNLELELKEPFKDKIVSEKEFILKEELLNLLELNISYLDESLQKEQTLSNISKIKEMLEILD